MAERFKGLIEGGDGPGAYIVIPFDARKRFGRARPPVRAAVNGHELRSTLAVYGGHAYLGLNAAFRRRAGVDVGDDVAVTLELDNEPRTVAVPADLASALASEPGLRARFNTLSLSHRREYVTWVTEAKRADTRARRIARTAEMVSAGASPSGGQRGPSATRGA